LKTLVLNPERARAFALSGLSIKCKGALVFSSITSLTSKLLNT
jgi:hypothetical protein